MPLSEFDLIERFFFHCGASRDDVALGVGDDCALLNPPPGKQLAVSIDTLVSGVHFFPDAPPESVGYKALAVNLSDLAAMGAEPAWVSLALTLPESRDEWMSGFAKGFCGLAKQHGLTLIGGDTTQGPLTVSVQIFGLVETGRAMTRSGARPGDFIYVSGTLGDAGLALRMATQQSNRPEATMHYLVSRLERPEPRVALGLALAGIASAAIDISDGLLADLGHVLDSSGGLGASIELAEIPCSRAVADYIRDNGSWDIPLASGDDYELCIAVRPDDADALERAASQCDCALRRVGIVEQSKGIRCRLPDGQIWIPESIGYEHFKRDQ